MKLFLVLILLLQVGCGSIANFVIGASGNVFSDSINREIEQRNTPSNCQTKK